MPVMDLEIEGFSATQRTIMVLREGALEIMTCNIMM
jgi:hypothetical protein